MTQPIQEPTTQRSVSGLDWGQSQLARRPAPPPTGGFTPVVAQLEHWDNVFVLASGSWDIFDNFDKMETGDTSYLTVSATGIAGVQPGVYTATLSLSWGTSWNGADQGVLIDDTINVWPPFTNVSPKHSWGEEEDNTISITKVYGDLDWDLGHGGAELPTFTFGAAQGSGSNKNVQGRAYVVYWGPGDST